MFYLNTTRIIYLLLLLSVLFDIAIFDVCRKKAFNLVETVGYYRISYGNSPVLGLNYTNVMIIILLEFYTYYFLTELYFKSRDLKTSSKHKNDLNTPPRNRKNKCLILLKYENN